MDETDYLSRRAQEELTAAVHAQDPRVRNLHLELADAYSFRLRETRELIRRSNFMLSDAR